MEGIYELWQKKCCAQEMGADLPWNGHAQEAFFADVTDRAAVVCFRTWICRLSGLSFCGKNNCRSTGY